MIFFHGFSSMVDNSLGGSLDELEMQNIFVFGRLTGRGTVEFTIEKGDGATFFPTAGGQPKSFATIQVCGN